MNKSHLALASLLLGSVLSALAQEPSPRPQSSESIGRMAELIYKKIVRLPNYGVFDQIRFGIHDYTVYLRGFASRPTLKDSAERLVKKLEGVDKVVNEIEVLPLSRHDDNIRLGVYRAIYGHSALQRYSSTRGRLFDSQVRRNSGITNDPPVGWHAIHIIVKNGHVTLEGVVDRPMDSSIAEIQALSVPGVFSVTNDLEVTSGYEKKAKEKQLS